MKVLKTLSAKISPYSTPILGVIAMRGISVLTLLFLLSVDIAGVQTNPPAAADISFATGYPGSDYSSAGNKFGGFFNSPIYPNLFAFAALKEDGSIKVWGGSGGNPTESPTDAGYISINGVPAH